MRFISTAGLVVGCMVGAAGITWVLSDAKSRRMLAQSRNRVLDYADDMIDSMV